MNSFSVIIPTYNRKLLLNRCIGSVLKNGIKEENIIVIDDASIDGTDSLIRENYSQITYHKFNTNKGVCCARNFGLQICKTQFGILVDSDDELTEDAVEVISKDISQIGIEGNNYTVYYFLRDKAHLKNIEIKFIRTEDIINKSISGNTTEVININRFNAYYAFPEKVSPIGGEHLLWLEVADKETIPIINKVVTIENNDASNRLTSINNQIKNAYYHAVSQQLTIEKFGSLYYKYNKEEYLNRLYACSIYYKLSGDFSKSLIWAIRSIKASPRLKSIFPFVFSLMPRWVAKRVYTKWRGL